MPVGAVLYIVTLTTRYSTPKLTFVLWEELEVNDMISFENKMHFYLI